MSKTPAKPMFPQPIFSQLILGTADTLSGDLEAGSHHSTFGPVGLAFGAAPPAFDQTTSVAAFDHTYRLNPTDRIHPTLQVDATKLVNTVGSRGLGVDSLSTQATADIASADIVLTDNPPFSLGVLGLSVAASFIQSTSNASYVFGPNRGFLGGDASFGSLTIGGALLEKPLTFAGDAAANTILYKSAAVTITLDKQTLSEFLPPTSGPIQPSRITTDAISIDLHNAHVFGRTLSGEINIGETSASLFPPLHA